MPEGHDTIIEVSNIMSFVLYTQILKQSVLKPASPGITLNPLSVHCIAGFEPVGYVSRGIPTDKSLISCLFLFSVGHS